MGLPKKGRIPYKKNEIPKFNVPTKERAALTMEFTHCLCFLLGLFFDSNCAGVSRSFEAV